MRPFSPLERRLRRLAVLVGMFAVVAAVAGMLPHGIKLRPSELGYYKHTTDWSDTMHAGGWAVVIWAAALSGLVSQMWQGPTRRFGVVVIIFALVCTFIGAVLWAFENYAWEERYILLWPGKLTVAAAGSAGVLMFVALPIVLLVSDGARLSEAPGARVL